MILRSCHAAPVIIPMTCDRSHDGERTYSVRVPRSEQKITFVGTIPGGLAAAGLAPLSSAELPGFPFGGSRGR